MFNTALRRLGSCGLAAMLIASNAFAAQSSPAKKGSSSVRKAAAHAAANGTSGKKTASGRKRQNARVNHAARVAKRQGKENSGNNAQANAKGNKGDASKLPPLANLAKYQEQMVAHGHQFCDPAQIAQLGTWEGNVWYYDGTRVFMQIGDYTKDPSWYTCASYVRDLYRNYVLTDGKTPAWRVFPHGLAEDYLRNNQEQSKEAVRLLAQESAYAAAGGGESHELSRETAYVINAYLKAEDVGFPRSPMFDTAVNYALGHLDQWTGTQSAPFVKPFMMALTSEALIGVYDKTGDKRIPAAIQHAFDWLWDNMWDPSTQSFPYILCRGPTTNQECSIDHTGEGVDLNLLIVPVFGWLYKQTGDPKYIERGDALFNQGVEHAWLDNGKQFSQNYRWSMKYLEWRDGK